MPSQRKSARSEKRAWGRALVSPGSQPGLGGWEGLPGEIIKSEGQSQTEEMKESRRSVCQRKRTADSRGLGQEGS